MDWLNLSALPTGDDSIEVVERKGLGHPDTICDALAEALSRRLCHVYRERFGQILHHNVDKALLCGGRATAAFGGGTVEAPIQIYLAGRATTEVGGASIPIDALAIDGSRDWLRRHLHALDAERHVVLHHRIQPGSQDLRTLFARGGAAAIPLANDTSIGVGYAPLSPLERLVLAVEKTINGRARHTERPAWGEDIKVMAVRRHESVHLTIACALVGRYLADIDDYLSHKAALAQLAHKLAGEHGFADCEVGINMADSPTAGSVYLTVTGTSAEAGDDGEVGRGNRVNGLITPGRPMSLEAAAGKNPVSHVGKIYNIVAQRLTAAIVDSLPDVVRAHCLLVSRIGAPVCQPATAHLQLTTRAAVPVVSLRHPIEEITADHLARIPQLVDAIVAGDVDVY
jgi:S-adenosylmethionine synthetase